MRPALSLAAILALAAAPATAAMTPEQVWDALQEAAAGLPGGALSAGSESRDGDTLILTDVVFAVPTETGSATAALSSLRLRQRPDGTVEAVPDPEVRLLGSGTDMSGRATEAEGTITLTGASAVIGGTPGNLTVTKTVAALEGRLAITDPSAGNGASKANPYGEGADLGSVTLSGSSIAGTVTLAEAPGAEQVVRLTVGDLSAEVEGLEAEEAFLVSTALSGLDVSVNGRLMGGVDADPFPGGALKGSVGLAALTLGFQVPQPGGGQASGSFRLSGASVTTDTTVGPQAAPDAVPEVRGAASLRLAEMVFSSDGLADESGGVLNGSGTARDGALDVSLYVPAMGSEAGFPEALDKGFAVSLQASSGPSDQTFQGTEGGLPLSFSVGSEGGTTEFALSRAGLIADVTNRPMTISGMIPQMSLPVDASIREFALRFAMPVAPGPEAQPFVVRLRLVDLMAADALWDTFDAGRLLPRTPATLIADASGTARVTGDLADSPEGDVPLEPVTLDLTDLRATFGGAEVTGKGALTFAMAGETAIPAGSVSLGFTGVYGLLGKLGELGLLPPDAAIGVRGVLAAIGKPVGDDRLTSEIEFRPDGTVLANGAPVPF